MSINFIFSEIENDLKSICINKVLESNEDKKLIIVPEQNTLSTDSKLIEMSKNKSFMFSNVLSFKRLAFYVLNETNIDTKDNLTSLGQSLIIKKVLHEVEDDLRYYKNSVRRAGFVEKISETINQMSRYAFSQKDLSEVIDIYNAKNTSNSFKNKLFDLNLIYKKFIAKIENSYLTNDGLLEILCKSIKDSEYIKSLDIYITSFYSFSTQENRVIYELGKHCKNLTILLPLDKNENIKSIKEKNIDVYDFFYEPKNAVKKLIKLFDNIENVEISIEHVNSEPKNENIDHIIKNYNKHKVDVKDNSDNVKFYKCKNKYNEVDFVAKYIKHKVLEKKYRYKDIVLVCPDIDNYEHILKNTFQKYDIPIFYDKKDLLYKNIIIEALRSAMDSVVKNMKYESVFRFLKSGIGNFNERDICQLENYIIEYGIRGYMWGFDYWEFGINQNNQYDLDEINKLKTEVNEILGVLINKKMLIKEHCRNLYSFIEKLDIYAFIENKLLDESISISEKREFEQTWEKLIQLLEHLYDFLGDESVTFEEFASIFEAGVQSEEFGQIPTYDDQVIVANINRSKIEDCKIMIFIDATDKNYPKYTEQNIIFDVDEMNNILNTGYRFFDDSLERFYAQNLVLFLNIAKVSDELVFVMPTSTIKGEILNPATAVSKIQMMFDGVYVDIDNEQLNSNNDIKENIYKHRNNNKVFTWYKNNKGRLEKNLFDSIENGDFLKHKLSKDIVDKIYGNELLASVSKLEKYVQCPYAYYLTYNIKAKQKKVYEANALDYGQIFHKIFEIFFDHMKLSKKKWEEIDEKYISDFVEDNIKFCIENMNKNIFTRDSRYKIFLARISEISKVSIKAIVYHIVNGEFNTFYTETSFKEEGNHSTLNVEVLDKNIKISGEIDRVDLYKEIKNEDGNLEEKYFAKVIDYKSSAKSFSHNDFYNGIQLQLIVYLDTVMKNYEKMIGDMKIDELCEAGIFYFTAQNPIIDKDKIVENIDKEIIKQFKMKGIFAKDTNVIYSIDSNLKNSVIDEKGKLKSNKSEIINANFKTNGELDSRSSAENPDDIQNFRAFANKKIVEIGEDIFSGNISAKPVKLKNVNYCDYCDFSAVCKINLVEHSKRFREFEELSKEEIRRRIRESLDN